MSSHPDSDINVKQTAVGSSKSRAHASEPHPGVPAAIKRKASISTLSVKKVKATTEGGDDFAHLDYRHVPSTWLDKDPTRPGKSIALQLSHRKGDMFADAPKGCVLIHACNTQGHWGAGIAKSFKQSYPKLYIDHHKFCVDDHSKSKPVPTGTAQLLAPRNGQPEHWIGCLFTSAKYGKGKDKPDQIIKNTASSMQMLLQLLSVVAKDVTAVRMCKINSGKFGVPWEKTEDVLKVLEMQPWWPNNIEVWEPEE